MPALGKPPVAEAAAAAAKELYLLAVLVDLAEKFARLGIKYHRSGRYLDDDILAVLAETAAARAALAVAGKHVAVEFQGQQSPHLLVAAEYHVAAAAAVAAVRAALGHILGAIEMTRARAALAAAAVYLHIIYKIAVSHNLV